MRNSYEYIVFPGHGVGKLKDSLNPHLLTATILNSGVEVAIPIIKAEDVGVRDLISTEEAHEVLKILNSKGNIAISTWNTRYRDYMKKMKTGCATKVAEVIRDINTLGVKKELSFGERKMIDQAYNVLETELKIVLGNELCILMEKER